MGKENVMGDNNYLMWCGYGAHYITTEGWFTLEKKGNPPFISVYICRKHYDERENNPHVIEARKQMAIREEFHLKYMKGQERYRTKDGAKRFCPSKKKKLRKKFRKNVFISGSCLTF